MNLRNGKKYLNDHRDYWLPIYKNIHGSVLSDGMIYTYCERFIFENYYNLLI